MDWETMTADQWSLLEQVNNVLADNHDYDWLEDLDDFCWEVFKDQELVRNRTVRETRGWFIGGLFSQIEKIRCHLDRDDAERASYAAYIAGIILGTWGPAVAWQIRRARRVLAGQEAGKSRADKAAERRKVVERIARSIRSESPYDRGMYSTNRLIRRIHKRMQYRWSESTTKLDLRQLGIK